MFNKTYYYPNTETYNVDEVELLENCDNGLINNFNFLLFYIDFCCFSLYLYINKIYATKIHKTI
jgi:hypothetical protein